MSSDGATAQNKSRDENTYVDIYQGAYYNGKNLDVRIYTYSSGPYHVNVTDDVITFGSSSSVTIWQEYHFYEAGTLSDGSARETSFKGIFAMMDVDAWSTERYSFTNGGAGVYLHSDTNIYFKDGAWGGRSESSPSNSASWIWVEASSHDASPFQMAYYSNAHRSEMRKPGTNTITLNFPASDDKEPIAIQMVQYGTFDTSKLEVTPNDPNLGIEGWYTTDRYEIKYPEKFMVDGDISLYAKYVKNNTITGPESPTKGTDQTEILPDGPGSTDPTINNPTDSNSSSGDSNNNSNSSDGANDSNNNSNRATSATNTQITYATDSDNIAVPSTSVYTPTRAVTTSSATQVSYPNTGFQTSQTNSVDGVTTVNVLRIVLAIIGVAGVVQIIFARHHKLHF